jgi:prepilin-type N-terminal cleavage/methylation domain-containing protein
VLISVQKIKDFVENNTVKTVGFTLIELLIVMLLLGIIAIILIQYFTVESKAADGLLNSTNLKIMQIKS